MLDTPVSDLIDEYAKDHRVGLSALFDALLGATLGIQLEHVPERAVPGEPFVTQPEDKISYFTQRVPDGRKLIRVGADPVAYSVNFPRMIFNAQVGGRQLFEMILNSSNFDGALVLSARTQVGVMVGRPAIHALLELTPEQLQKRAAWRARAVRVRELPRWHVEKAAVIGFLDYLVGLLLVAGAAWGAARLVLALRGIVPAIFARSSNGETVIDAVRLGVTVVGWVAVTVYASMLTSRRAFEGFHYRAVSRLAQLITLFEFGRIYYGPSIVEAVGRTDGMSAAAALPGWLFALAELPLHPYVLAGCMISLHLIVPRVMAHERRTRERAARERGKVIVAAPST